MPGVYRLSDMQQAGYWNSRLRFLAVICVCYLQLKLRGGLPGMAGHLPDKKALL